MTIVPMPIAKNDPCPTGYSSQGNYCVSNK